uniref:Transposon protein, putative, CACTA, En/Spm sub-class n=1 Tax=Oryza sativa subsp. japonica TaxID=39947 RepID=Q2QMN0_ORYSJ|nr:transposon protein, putative, CACTA, En/Spm sub-class [Oryza sativa Japonica Group]
MDQSTIDRSWMYAKNLKRHSTEYRKGVIKFMNSDYMCCPCADCKNENMFDSGEDVHGHLIQRGFMEGYTCWVKHGEQESGSGAAADRSGAHNQEDENEHEMFIPSPLDGEMVDVDHDLLQDMLRDVEDPAQNERDGMKFSRLVSDSETPLYAGCKAKHTKLSVTLDLMKLKASSGWTDKSFTDLLGILKAMLPVENTLPETTYEAKQVLCPLGLEVRRIHAYPNDCILYHKQYADLDACPVCKASRYKRKKSADEGNKSKRGGPRQPDNDIDVFLEPVIDDLEILWKEGVKTWDAYGQENFKLRVLLFCTINDYPALGNLSGQTIKGKKACSDCKEHTRSRWLKISRKMVYMGHRRWLPLRHTFRRKKKIFNGKRELQPAPKDLSGDEVHNMVKDISNEFGKKRKRSKTKEKGMWKKKSIFWRLPYWKDLDVRHCIDLMHVEKNVCESLVGLMLNIPGKTKDGLNARLDLQDMNIRSELQPIRDAETGKVYLPLACHTLSKDEKIAMLSCLKDIKIPSGYSARISKYVKLDDLKLVGMKSHDCHVLITQILPVAIRGILPPKVRHTIQRLCAFFNAIGQKVIDPEDLDGLQTDIVNTLCHLEMFFPLSFFDIMVHLPVHLVKQTKLCGPAFLREMWPFERYMGVLKSYVRNRAKPEGSIIEGYTTEEAIEFCVNYMSDADPIGVPASRHEGRLSGVGIIGRKRIRPDQASYAQAHYAVLQHMAKVGPYFEEHLAKIRDENLGRSDAWINREHNSRFNEWFKNCVAMSTVVPNETVQLLGMGPSWTIDTWQGYDINGYTFYTVKQDDKSTVQNSGVLIDAFQDQVGSNTYYGRIEEILELNYVKFKVPLFRCRWVNLRTGVKADKEDFTLVDLSKVGYADEPFVLVKQVEQIFYLKDPSNKKMHIVRDGKRRIVGVDNVVDEEEYNHNLHVRPHIDLDDDPQEPLAYARSDHNEGITL